MGTGEGRRLGAGGWGLAGRWKGEGNGRGGLLLRVGAGRGGQGASLKLQQERLALRGELEAIVALVQVGPNSCVLEQVGPKCGCGKEMVCHSCAALTLLPCLAHIQLADLISIPD